MNFPTLSNDDLFRAAPAIFANRPDEKASDRYQFLRTIEMVDLLRQENWFPTSVKQSKTRSNANAWTATHMIRFRNPDMPAVTTRGGRSNAFPEIALTNSHNLAKAYQLLAGVFEMICENGLVVGDTFDRISIRHTGNALEDMRDATYRTIELVPEITGAIETWSQVQLPFDRRLQLATSALKMKHGVHGQQLGDKPAPTIIFGEVGRFRKLVNNDPDANESGNIVYIPNKPEQLLMPRRYEDRAAGLSKEPVDLWTTYNVIQENLVKGGLRSMNQNWRRQTSRGIRAIDEDTRVNRALWNMSDNLAKLAA